MSRSIQALILLILPVLLVMSSLFYKNSKGEFFLNSQYDPSYPYLMNSLNLSSSIDNGIRLYEHPGTTVIVSGSFIIWFLHLTEPADPDIVTDVFSRPEFYLDSINLVFLFLNFLALFMLGIVAVKSYGSLSSAVFLQFTPFLSVTTYFWITNVSPEPLLIFSVLLLITIAVSCSSKDDLNTKASVRYAILFAIVSGFGLATKISFFPLLIIPLVLLRKISIKVLFCSVTLLFFLIFIIPAISWDHPLRLIYWLKNIVTHSGKYGTGENNFVNTGDFFRNIRTIFIKEPVFGYSYLLIALAFLLQFIPWLKKKVRSNKNFRLLTGIFLAMTIQIIIVCKHFELHYLIPAYMLIVLGLYAVNSTAADLFPDMFKKNKLVFLYAVMIVILCFQIPAFINSSSYYSKRRDASRNFIREADSNFSGHLTVSSYGISSKKFALYLGAVFGGSQKTNYYSRIESMFQGNYYYDKWSKNVVNVEDSAATENRLRGSDMFYFLCDNETVLKDFLIILKDITHGKEPDFKKVFSNANGESVYEVTFSPG